MIQYKQSLFGVLNTDNMEGQPLVLLDGGIETRFQETYKYQNNMRDNYSGYLFQYTFSGCGWFEKDGKKNQLLPGMGFLAKIPEKSCYYLAEDGTPWEFLYLHFDGPAAKPFVQKLEQICGCVFCLSPSSQPILQAIGFHARITSGEQLKKYEGQEFLYAFLCSLLREAEYPSVKEENSIVQLALQILDREYATLESMDKLAQRLHISKEHLTRCFKAKQGIPPVRYLTNRRLQSAMNELLSTEDTIHAIAIRNGFSNGNYFAKVFRKYLGMSPEEYRAH